MINTGSSRLLDPKNRVFITFGINLENVFLLFYTTRSQECFR